MTAPPVFGEQVPGEVYKKRFVVCAVIVDADGRVAVVKVGDRYFLPGGGIESGETETETLTRELREECGLGVVVGLRLGQAVYHQYAPPYGGWTIHSTYYRATFGAPTGTAPEAEHELLLMTPDEACAVLFRRSDAWIVTQETA